MRNCAPVFLILGLFPAAFFGQTSVISASFQQGNSAATVASGSAVGISALAVGGTSTGTITITYIGQTQLRFPVGFSFQGSPDLTVTPATPLSPLSPLQSISFNVTYKPTTSGTAVGQFGLPYQDAASAGLFTLNIVGTVPNVVVSYTLAANSNSTPLSNGDTLPFGQVVINTATDATVSVSNLGSGSTTISAIAVSGGSFQILGLPLLPATLGAGTQLRFIVRFLPQVTGVVTGSLQISLDSGTFSANLSGTSLRSLLSYTLVFNQVTTPLIPNQTIDLGDVQVGRTTSAVVQIQNLLTVPTTVSAILINGDGLSLTAGPILPVILQPQDQTSLTVTFAPQTAETVVGHLAIGSDSFTITARAVGASLQISYAIGGASNPIFPGQTAPFPTTTVGQSVAATFTFTNHGTGPFSFISLGVTDPTGSFLLSNLPVLPMDLQAGASLSLTVSFTPQTPETVTGTLNLNGTALLSLSGVATASSSLQFSYQIGTTSLTIVDGGLISFPSTMVTQTTSAQFTIKNTGATPASIVSVGLNQTQSAFSLLNLPALPTQLAPNQSITFTLNFLPQVPGTATATLSIDSVHINLSASAPNPPVLPAYQISGASGTLLPFQQPSISLSLLSAYPLDIRGTLTLSEVSSSFAQDPAVQFSSGGQTVAFTISANQLQAKFGNGSTQIQFQTGSVAGTILITPAFQTVSGLNLTPSNPTTVSVVIPPLAPVLLTARLGTLTTNSFSVIVTGYTTTRSLQTLSFTFTGTSNQTLGQTTVDLSAASTVWFASASSAGFGGQFSVEVPFSLVQAGSSSTTNLTANIHSIAVQATNVQGTSNALQFLLQ